MSRDSQDDAPRIVGTRTVYEGWARYLVAEVRMPDGSRIGREVEDHGPAVAVLPYDRERRVALLVRQFRTPPCFVDGTASLLEAPAGLREEDDPEACARREAFEEVGLRLSILEPAGRVWSLPGLSTERMDLFLAPTAPPTGKAPAAGWRRSTRASRWWRLPWRRSPPRPMPAPSPT